MNVLFVFESGEKHSSTGTWTDKEINDSRKRFDKLYHDSIVHLCYPSAKESSDSKVPNQIGKQWFYFRDRNLTLFEKEDGITTVLCLLSIFDIDVVCICVGQEQNVKEAIWENIGLFMASQDVMFNKRLLILDHEKLHIVETTPKNKYNTFDVMRGLRCVEISRHAPEPWGEFRKWSNPKTLESHVIPYQENIYDSTDSDLCNQNAADTADLVNRLMTIENHQLSRKLRALHLTESVFFDSNCDNRLRYYAALRVLCFHLFSQHHGVSDETKKDMIHLVNLTRRVYNSLAEVRVVKSVSVPLNCGFARIPNIHRHLIDLYKTLFANTEAETEAYLRQVFLDYFADNIGPRVSEVDVIYRGAVVLNALISFCKDKVKITGLLTMINIWCGRTVWITATKAKFTELVIAKLPSFGSTIGGITGEKDVPRPNGLAEEILTRITMITETKPVAQDSRIEAELQHLVEQRAPQVILAPVATAAAEDQDGNAIALKRLRGMSVKDIVQIIGRDRSEDEKKEWLQFLDDRGFKTYNDIHRSLRINPNFSNLRQTNERQTVLFDILMTLHKYPLEFEF